MTLRLLPVPDVSRSAPRRRRSREKGSVYLLALFMVLMMAAATEAVLQSAITQGRRTREDEMIWRGNQYVRAIRLYYRKTGHYPGSLDDLQTGLPDLHFLRAAAYKDPMNAAGDGAWRLIYVNASGQIIGSSRYATLQQMALMDLNGGQIPVNASLGSLVGTPVSSLAAASSGAAGASGTSGASGSNAQNPAPSGNTPSQSAPGSTTDSSAAAGSDQNGSTDQSASSAQPVNPLSLLKPTGPVDGPVLGAFVTGVRGGTDSEAKSIKVITAGKKYKDWEFIWNPLEDQARAVQAGLTPGGLIPGQSTGQGAGAGQIPGQPPGFGGTGGQGLIGPPPSSGGTPTQP
jgi:hypothetical protein